MNEYGTTLYEPSLWDWVTGMDWGTSRCLRNSKEAYVCFSEMMFRAEAVFGWNTELVTQIVNKANRYSGSADLSTSATFFWSGVQDDFMEWVREAGWNIADLPKWKGVLKEIDLRTNNAFSYKAIKEDADRIFQNTALKTTGDVWHLWTTKVPKQARWAAYVVIGGTVITYLSPVIRLVAKLITPKNKD